MTKIITNQNKKEKELQKLSIKRHQKKVRILTRKRVKNI